MFANEKVLLPLFFTMAYNTVLNEGGIINPKESWDAVETCVKSIDGEVIVSSTGDGGCQYYSSGVVDVNEELFNAVK